MVRALDTLDAVADDFDAIVLDQWGVLHDGTTPYPSARDALHRLRARGITLAVLSNSGKRAAPNAARIVAMGFAPDLFAAVMTSGEALWADIAAARLPFRRLHPITRDPGDAADWAAGLDIALTDSLAQADAVLLMGLPDGATPADYAPLLAEVQFRALPILCTNPDRASPRAGGVTVLSPGALAHAHEARGGSVRFYGKPHLPIFRAVETALGIEPSRLLMVGDSLEHDIAGAHAAGWSTAFVRGGLHGAAFTANAHLHDTIATLAAHDAAPLPTYTLATLG